MARSVNKAILIGHLGKDPEVRYMPNGKAVTNVSIATSESWKDKQTGERQDRTEWHNLVFYSPLAEIAGEYLRKGSLVYIEGRIQTRKWQTKEGQDRYTTEIVVSEMSLLDKRGSSQADSYDQSPAYPTPTGRSFPDAAPSRQSPPGMASGTPPMPPASYDDALPPARIPTPVASSRPRPPVDPAPKSDDNFEDDIPF